MRASRIIGFAIVSLLFWCTASTAQAPLPVQDYHFHAKGWSTAQLDLQSGREVSDFGLSISTNGIQFHSLNAGLPRPGGLFKSVHVTSGRTALLVSLVGRFVMGKNELLFTEAGSYVLRWDVRFGDRDEPVYIEIDQPIEVAPALEADKDFLLRVGDPALLMRLFGDDFFERQTDTVRERMLSPEGADERALEVIARLLKFTRAAEPGDVAGSHGTPEMALVWADTLWPLAQELPESSYAPYAAYYAGCSYMLSAMLTNKQAAGEICAAGAAARSPHYDLARSCLNFASERADPYLKPRVAYMQAFWKGVNADWDEALRLTDELGPTVQADAKFSQQLQELRAGLQQEKSKRAGQ